MDSAEISEIFLTENTGSTMEIGKSVMLHHAFLNFSANEVLFQNFQFFYTIVPISFWIELWKTILFFIAFSVEVFKLQKEDTGGLWSIYYQQFLVGGKVDVVVTSIYHKQSISTSSLRQSNWDFYFKIHKMLYWSWLTILFWSGWKYKQIIVTCQEKVSN